MSRPGIVFMNEFETGSNHKKPFSNYVDYIGRTEATKYKEDATSKKGSYDNYLSYMDNPEKQADIFTLNRDHLTVEEKKNLKHVFDIAEENNAILWIPVISFDNAWLEKNHLYDSTTNVVDEDALRGYTRGALTKLLNEEGLSASATWAAAIHHNTDNIHIHVAITEMHPTRPDKEYQVLRFSKKWLDQNGIVPDGTLFPTDEMVNTSQAPYGKVRGNLQNAYYELTHHKINCTSGMKMDSDGNLEISVSRRLGELPEGVQMVRTYTRPDGAFKKKNIERTKSYFVNQIIKERDTNLRANEILRNEIMPQGNQDFDATMMNLYNEIYQEMRTRKLGYNEWSYGTNKIADLRPKLDELTDLYINRYKSKEFREYNQIIKSIAANYQAAYGGKEAGTQFIETKNRDLHKRMGNAILRSMKEQDKARIAYIHKAEQTKSASAKQANAPPRFYNKNWDLQRNMYRLERRLKHELYREWDKVNRENMAAYYELQREIERST